MLREITTIRTFSTNRRRWFSDADMDLYIWFHNQVPVQFQLTYNKQQDEHAISWDNTSGFRHNRVDDGEHTVSDYKMSPILLADGEFDAITVARKFLLASDYLDATLADFIYARLIEYPQQHKLSSGPHTRRETDR